MWERIKECHTLLWILVTVCVRCSPMKYVMCCVNFVIINGRMSQSIICDCILENRPFTRKY